jgi:hypothetical protein
LTRCCVRDFKIILAEVQGKSALQWRCAAKPAARVMMFTDRELWAWH